MFTNIEIIIGTYEGFLVGYKLEYKDETVVLTQSFADKSHTGSLKCLAVQGKWIATGATDDRIFIYDMKTRKQSQILLTHEGTVNTLSFTPDETHLLSGGDDGRMIAVRVNTWFTEANWTKAHGGCAVTHICCHPSSKLALSLGSDLVLRTWNLIKGRVAYKTNLKSKTTTLGTKPDCLAWSSKGDYFTLTGQRGVEIRSTKTADVVKSQKTNSKPVCVSWLKGSECLIGLENGKILWLNAVGKEQHKTIIEAHSTRVKTMCFRDNILVTASSSGEVKLWKVNTTTKELNMIAVTNIGCRPTCVAILDLDQFGPSYIVNSKITKQSEQKENIERSTSKPLSRGVVTIEYEDKEKESAQVDNINSDKEVNDDDSEKVKSSDGKNSAENDDDDDDDDAEPPMSVVKSQQRKPKQKINKQNIRGKGNSIAIEKTAKKKRQAETKATESSKKQKKAK